MRSFIFNRVLFKQVDPIILFGLGLGLLGGLGLAIAGNLLIENILTSYQSFLQRSLIGLRGSLVLETQESSGYLRRFRAQWEIKNSGFSSSPVWQSRGPIQLELKQSGKIWKRQVQVILQDRDYLMQKMAVNSSECTVDKNAQAFGNALLFLTLLDFNAAQNTTLQADVFGGNAMPVLFSKCPIETGMMTDYPLLILDWKAVGWNPDEVAESLEFSTYTRQETDFLEQKIDKVMQQVPRETGEQYRIENLYRNKKMKLATSLSEQARWLALGIAGITLTLSGIILFFGFLLLLEFKRVVIETFRLMGVSRLEVTFGFMLGGGILGVVVASVGMLLAWSGRLLIQVQGWIPFEHFFTEWPPMLFVAVFVLTPICVAVFSAFVVRFRLPSQLNMSEMG